MMNLKTGEKTKFISENSIDDFAFDDFELERLIFIIKKKYQFDFSNYAIASFKRRINRIIRVFDFENISELESRLINDALFFEDFLNEITVNTTEFFRDPDFWIVLKTKVFPFLAQKEKIKIWHAGCSTGEESLSMAIALFENNLLDKSEIIASDINKNVLAIAQKAKYSKRNLELSLTNYIQSNGKNSLNNYFDDIGENIVFKPFLNQNTTFLRHNLADENIIGQFDLIINRNVMIYFDDNLQESVFKRFKNSMLPNAFLAFGSNENINLVKSSFDMKCVSSAEKLFQKLA